MKAESSNAEIAPATTSNVNDELQKQKLLVASLVQLVLALMDQQCPKCKRNSMNHFIFDTENCMIAKHCILEHLKNHPKKD
jgi:hypothetical protein